MRISDWSSDVCSSDLHADDSGDTVINHGQSYRSKSGGSLFRGLTNAEHSEQPSSGEVRSSLSAYQGPQVVAYSGRDFLSRHPVQPSRSEEHTSELQSLMRTSYAVFCLKKKTENRR